VTAGAGRRVRSDPGEARRYPWWQLLLLGVVSMVEALLVRPLRRMWVSDDPLDTYGLVHLASVAGDAMVTIALAGSVFFEIPPEDAETRIALYLALTMAPLAVAGPVLVPLLDRAGPRRAISLASAAGRALVALVLAPRAATVAVFPLAFLLLVLSKVHTITKNGLTIAYAGADEGLVRANARLGRIAVVGALLAAGPAVTLLRVGGAGAALYGAAVAYAIAALLNVRLPHPRLRRPGRGTPPTVGPRGAIAELRAPAIGGAGLRAAAGFLLFLLAFALRRSGEPAWWFGVLGGMAAVGALAGDLLAPRLPVAIREEAVVIACVLAAGVGSVFAFALQGLVVLAAFAFVVGLSGELGRLAFQSLLQRAAPGGAHGRVFVRYEILFQLAWVAGALLPALLPIGFREGLLVLFGLYSVVVLGYLAPDVLARFRSDASP
jgi:hypothetical protein